MAKNVKFVQTTKQKWLKRDTYDPAALYFCIDTGELFKGNVLFTEGVKIVPTRDALPSFECAADGVVYYVADTKAGFMIAPDRTGWLQTIYAPVADVNSIPEGEEYNVVTTVGAVRDIENAIYDYIDDEIANIEVSGSQGADGKTPYIQDGYWYIDGVNTEVKAEGVDGKDGTNGLNGKDGVDGKDGQNGQDGKDGKGISAITKTSTNGLIDTYCITFSDGATTYFDVTNGKDGVNGQDGAPGKDGVDGVDGAPGKDGIDGKDGETPTVEIGDDGYWVINGTKTEHKAIGVDGKDGVDGAPGTDGKDGTDGSPGKDGANGKDGTDGKDGESAYEIWLNAGHSGSEADFLQWLKGDNDPFGNVIASIGCAGIEAGTSLNGKTVKDVLIMLLGIQEAPKSVVEYIMENRIPAYNGTANSQVEAVEYQLFDANAMNYADQGCYTTTDEEGNITSAGYQLTIEGNNNADAQVVAILSNAVIKMAYRYDLGGTNTWLPYTFDLEDEANYWILGEPFTTTVNGEEVVYQTYMYNIDVVGGGDALTSTEYWRFEIEVTN